MKIKMKILEKFDLPDGTTILACTGYNNDFDFTNKELNLVFGEDVIQTITISGERKMLNQKYNLDQRAFETKDSILLSQEEAKSGNWQLVSL